VNRSSSLIPSPICPYPLLCRDAQRHIMVHSGTSQAARDPRRSRQWFATNLPGMTPVTCIAAITHGCTVVKIAAPSDALPALIGLGGVLLGGLITGGFELLRFRLGNRTDRAKEVRHATGDLIGSANALVTLRGALASPRAAEESLIEWIQALSVQAERVQQASETIVRLGADDLGVAAERVAQAALTASVNVAEGQFPQELEAAVAEFQTLARGQGAGPADPQSGVMGPPDPEPTPQRASR
jgi:hypothetical protein